MLKTRVITALVLVAVLGSVLFALPPLAALLAFSVIAALAAWEWGGLLRWSQAARVAYAVALLLACGLLWMAPPIATAALLALSAAFWLGLVPFWFRHKWSLLDKGALGHLLGGLVILPTWAAMVALHAVSPWLLLAAMALVWVADIAAYFAGRAFGRHKLAPAISPGKTWEGVAGAVVGVLIYGAAVLGFSPLASQLPLPWPVLALLLLLLTAVSVAGDLFESLLKRQAGLKDSSNLLPGHGGVLDRIDALTSTLPLAALILYFVRP